MISLYKQERSGVGGGKGGKGFLPSGSSPILTAPFDIIIFFLIFVSDTWKQFGLRPLVRSLSLSLFLSHSLYP